MIVKFFRRSKEQGSAPLNYFLGAKRDREHSRVISGDPVITEHLINATKYQNKYKSGVLSFTERVNEISEDDKRKIMQEFEQTLFPGLEPDQYDILWIEHGDKNIDKNNPVGRLELNFLIPCQELRTGKRLQPFYAATDLKRVNAWKNKTNAEYGLSDPNEPRRKRLFNPFLGIAPKPTPYKREPKKIAVEKKLDFSSRDSLRESIEQHLRAELKRRDSYLVDRRTVINELENVLGLFIERKVKKSITVIHPELRDKNGIAMNVRLTGGIYDQDFNPKDYQPPAQKDYESRGYLRKLFTDDVYQEAIAVKIEQNLALYGDATAPAPFALDVQPVTIATTEQNPLEVKDQPIPRTPYKRHKR